MLRRLMAGLADAAIGMAVALAYLILLASLPN